MTRHRIALTLVVLTTALLCANVHAGKKNKDVPFIPPATNAAEFAALAADIRNGLDGGGRFEYVPANQERTLLDQLDTISALLAKGEPDGLNDTDKVALFNAQERANSILTAYDGNRKICQISSRTGSNRRETICTTYAEQRAAQERAARLVKEANHLDLPKGN